MIRHATGLALAACLAVSTATAQQPPNPSQNQHQPGIARMNPSPEELGRGVAPMTAFPTFAPGVTPSPYPGVSPQVSAAFAAPYANPYAYAAMGYGYGMMGSNYGSSYYNYSPTANLQEEPDKETKSLDQTLTASGVPSEGGKITWPLGLRTLPVDTLRKQVEAQLKLAAAGGANGPLLDDLRRNTEKLRATLLADKEWRFSLPLYAYEDSEQFLRKLRKAPTLLQGSAGQTGESQPQLKAVPSLKDLGAGATTVTVGVHDNIFRPETISVKPGTTVRWVNDGQHAHTVTFQDGHWDSGDIPPGATSSETFRNPGTFYYYCRHHKGMKGIVVVGDAAGTQHGAGSPGY